MKNIIVIQCRLSSERLRNKALFHLKFNRSIIEELIFRLKQYTKNPIILATSTNIEDKFLKRIAKNYKIKFFQGSLTNVRQRIFFASKGYENIYRFTADNPIVIEELINIANRHYTNYEYFSFKNHIRGTIFQSFRRKLIKDYINCSDYEKEHVIDHNKVFNKKLFNLKFNKKMKLSIDTIQDYYKVKDFYKSYFQDYKKITIKSLKKFMND